MEEEHLLLRGVGKVVEEVGLVFRPAAAVALERTQAHDQDVHVQIGDLGPGAEGGREAQVVEPPARRRRRRLFTGPRHRGGDIGDAEIFAAGGLGRALAGQEALALGFRDRVGGLGAAGGEEGLGDSVGYVGGGG